MKKIRFIFVGLTLLIYHPVSALAQDNEDGGLACGPDLSCDAETQYCSIVKGGPMGMATGFTCVDAPDTPPPPSCATISVPVGSECIDTEDGAVVTTQAP